MHDPDTLAFTIYSPTISNLKVLFRNLKKKRNGEPKTKFEYYDEFINIWHTDPCKDGTDDSCGWFLRSRHLDKEILKRIINRFDFDFDRTYEPSNGGEVINMGLFKPDGDPNMSTIGIVTNLFWMSAFEVFNHDWDKASKWMNSHMFDIIHFAENSCDSLYNGIHRIFEKNCNEEYTSEKREERIRDLASCVYSFIERKRRPWWKHPKWHIHHWRVQIRPLQRLRRYLFDRCSVCGEGFEMGESVYGGWYTEPPKLFRSTKNITHEKCISDRKRPSGKE